MWIDDQNSFSSMRFFFNAPAKSSRSGRAKFLMNFIENHWLLKKLRFKSWVFVVFQGRLGAGDYIGIWYNLGIIFEKLCLPPMICPWSPWSACDRPYIYRGLPSKCAKNFVLVNFFRFSKNREKSQKTQRKSGFLGHFLLIKTAFFLKRSSQKCIIKTIISYTTNAQLFHSKTFQWNVFKNVF